MVCDHFFEIRIVNDRAVAEYNKFLFAVIQIIRIGTQRIKYTGILPNVLPCHERRQDMKSVILSVKIPFLAGSEMVHQAVIIFLHDYADIFHSAVDHA